MEVRAHVDERIELRREIHREETDKSPCMAASDFQISARVRSVLARHWIDTHRLKIGSFRGTVRLTGDLHLICKSTARTFGGSQLETVLTEIRAVKGVQRVHIDVTNWRKDESGKLSPIEKRSTRTGQKEPRSVLVEDLRDNSDDEGRKA